MIDNMKGLVAKDLVNFGGGVGVFSVVADHDDQLRATAFTFPDGHSGFDPFGPCFIGTGGDDCPPASSDNCYRLASEFGISLLLNRGEKCVHIKCNPATCYIYITSLILFNNFM